MVTGGAGYKGCVLVPKLLAAGHEVVVFDLMLFGSFGLRPAAGLTIVEGDIRDTSAYARAVAGCTSVIHLACISNDPSYDLDPALSRTINYECFEPLVTASREAGVRRFVNVSSSSVYGVSDAPEVTEDHPLLPLTDYSRYKALCEEIVLAQQGPDFAVVNIRPATVCGYSPRMRFDLTVNILTNHAYRRGTITVFGGAQQRPNIHIEDVTDLYLRLLELPAATIAGRTLNVGYENHTVDELARMAARIVEEEFPEKKPVEIERQPTADLRSYRITSRRVTEVLGWAPARTIDDAVRDLCAAFRQGRFDGDTLSDERYINVKAVKSRAWR